MCYEDKLGHTIHDMGLTRTELEVLYDIQSLDTNMKLVRWCKSNLISQRITCRKCEYSDKCNRFRYITDIYPFEDGAIHKAMLMDMNERINTNERKGE